MPSDPGLAVAQADRGTFEVCLGASQAYSRAKGSHPEAGKFRPKSPQTAQVRKGEMMQLAPVHVEREWHRYNVWLTMMVTILVNATLADTHYRSEVRRKGDW